MPRAAILLLPARPASSPAAFCHRTGRRSRGPGFRRFFQHYSKIRPPVSADQSGQKNRALGAAGSGPITLCLPDQIF